VGGFDPGLALHLAHELKQRQRVVAEFGELVGQRRLGDLGTVTGVGIRRQQTFQILKAERGHLSLLLRPDVVVRTASHGEPSTRAAVKPPNPLATTSAFRSGRSRGAPRTRSIVQPGASLLGPTVWGMTPSRRDSKAVATSSAAPPPYSRPVRVFGTVTGTPRGPNNSVMASASARSCSGTPMPSANNTSMSSVDRRARSRARRMVAASAGGRDEPGGGSKPAAYPRIRPYERACRAAACVARSASRIAPPSPGTNPEASTSNGRYAVAGSDAVERSPEESCATRPYGHSEASVPPVTTSSTSRARCRAACPMASSPPACSPQITPHGPRIPCRIEICPVVAA